MSRFSNPQAQPPRGSLLGKLKARIRRWIRTRSPGLRPPGAQQPGHLSSPRHSRISAAAPRSNRLPYGQPQQTNPYAQPQPGGYAQPSPAMRSRAMTRAGSIRLRPCAMIRGTTRINITSNPMPLAAASMRFRSSRSRRRCRPISRAPRRRPSPTNPSGRPRRATRRLGQHGDPTAAIQLRHPRARSTTGRRRNRTPTRATMARATATPHRPRPMTLISSSSRRGRPLRLARLTGSGRTITPSSVWSPHSTAPALPMGRPLSRKLRASFEQTVMPKTRGQLRRARRVAGWTRIAVLLASTVLLGGGLAYAYNALLGGGPSGGTPPVVKSAEGPSR